MAKCNLLRPFDDQEGSSQFYTFSQWWEDLTLQNALGDAYRIVPSRYACFNIDLTDIKEKLQDEFEHKCAALRFFMDNDTHNEKFTPKTASMLFWNAMNSKLGSNWENMMFVGELDLQGTNYIDGTAYSELYCILPSNGKKMKDWQPGPSTSYPQTSYGSDEYGIPFGWQSLPSGASSDAAYPVDTPTGFNGPGIFTTEDNQTRYSSLNTLDSLHQMYMKDLLTNNNYFQVDDSVTSFNFNAIALFYDIVAKDENNNYHYIYTAVPMGMYVMNPAITKYVTNDEIYGQGTSYGLRVTSKFCAESLTTQTGDNASGNSVVADLGDIYPEIAVVMDRFNAAAEALDDYTKRLQEESNALTSHFNNFKDNRVNVPYIREIKGVGDEKPEKYWFVNGRSTGAKVEATNNIYYTGSGSGDLGDLIDQELNEELTDTTSQIYTTLTDIINNLIQASEPSNIIDTGSFIRYIPTDEYSGDSTIDYIPNIEDYQNILNGEGLLADCSSLKVLPRLELHNAETLSGAFINCSNLQVIYIPDTVSCEDFMNAFKNCSKLRRLTFDGTKARISTGAFDGCSDLEDLRITNIDPISLNTPIDLSQTNIDFASLESIVMSMKSQEYRESFDVSQDQPTVTIILPSHILPNSKSVTDLMYNALMNKNIRINFN